jgi:hypothetical protein
LQQEDVIGVKVAFYVPQDVDACVAGCCYSNALQNGHHCVEKSMHQNCPVCFEVLLLLVSCLRKFSFVVASNISEPKQHLWMMADFHA